MIYRYGQKQLCFGKIVHWLPCVFMPEVVYETRKDETCFSHSDSTINIQIQKDYTY